MERTVLQIPGRKLLKEVAQISKVDKFTKVVVGFAFWTIIAVTSVLVYKTYSFLAPSLRDLFLGGLILAALILIFYYTGAIADEIIESKEKSGMGDGQ